PGGARDRDDDGAAGHPAHAGGRRAALASYFRRKRLALERARLSQGVSIAAAVSALALRNSTMLEASAARIFSATMRRYSAGVQAPSAIMRLRWAMVSHEA